jgi:alpha-mannosidase
MSDRQRLLLSPYRLPTHHQVYLNEDEMAAWLNGFIVLWHPALLIGGERPPRVDSAYDHEQPTPGRAYVMPDSPPQFLPDDWPDRVHATGALKLPAYPDRDQTLTAMVDVVRNAAQTDEGREHFGTPEQQSLLDLPMEKVRPFFGIGFGYLMVDSLFEAMDHEKLLDVSAFWTDVHEAAKALLKPDAGEQVEVHLRSAAARLLSAREVLYAVNIHLLDVWRLDEDRLDEPAPAALAAGTALNVMATGRALERLTEQSPDRVKQLHVKLDEAIQPPVLEIIGGVYKEREDALLPVESQLWNLRQGRAAAHAALGANVEVLARRRSANHPHVPAWVQVTGLRRALLVSFDGAVTPNHRATVVNWSSPDGKAIDAFTRVPAPAHKAETFFNLVYSLHQSITQDSAPTLALIHQGEPAFPLYEDWLALSRLGPALGEWTTFSRYFSDALAGEYIGTANPDDFFADYLEERTNAHRPDAVSAFAAHARTRRRLDAAWTLAAVNRCLSAAGPTEEETALLDQLKRAEDEIETTGLDLIPGDAARGVAYEDPWAKKLADRLQLRAADNLPGFLLLNPCAFTRRVALELDGVTGPLPLEGPIKAAQVDADKARVVAEVPPLGFAWLPARGPHGTPALKPRIRLADGNTVRNEYFEAEIDPATGGIKAFRDTRTRLPRLGMQLAYNPGCRAEGRSVKVTHSGSALGEIISEGVVLNEHNEELAPFRIRLRAWLTRPVLDVRIELEPRHAPTGYPWHAYYGARFAWRDERSALMRGVNGLSMQTGHTRPVSPDFVEVKLGRSGTTILTGGLPFHQRQGPRMLDVILVPEGEQARVFDLGLAIDRDHPMLAAVGMISPLCVVPTTKGPPHTGPSGWLFHVDSPNLLLINLRPAADGSRGFIATFLETSGLHGGSAELRCVRDPVGAVLVDGDDQATTGLSVVGDAVRLEYAAGELFRVKVDLA